MLVKLQNARLSFANGLFNATALEPTQVAKFGADFLLTPDTTVYKKVDSAWVKTTMEDVLLEVANGTWKGKGKQMLESLEASKKCLRDGSGRVNKSGEVYAGYEGLKYVSAKTKTRPEIIDERKAPIAEQDGKIYSGCYVNVSFDVYGLADPKKKGVHSSLRAVQFCKDGPAFGAGTVAGAKDDFEELEVSADMNDLL